MAIPIANAITESELCSCATLTKLGLNHDSLVMTLIDTEGKQVLIRAFSLSGAVRSLKDQKI